MTSLLQLIGLKAPRFLTSPPQAAPAVRTLVRAPQVRMDDQAALPAPPGSIEPHVVYRASTMGRRFGRVAVQLGILSPRQVSELAAMKQKGDSRRMGDLAVAKGWMTQEQVEEIVTAQSVRIHVDNNFAASPPFLTWIEDLKRRGARPQIISVTAKDLVEYRERVGSDSEDNHDDARLDVLSDAKTLFSDAAAVGATDVCILVRERHAEVQMRVRGDYRVAKGWSVNRETGEALARAIYSGLATVKPSSYNELEFQLAQINGSSRLPGTGLSSVRLIRGPMYPTESKCSFLIARLQYNPDASATVGVSDRSLGLEKPWTPDGTLELDGYTPRQLELVQELIYKPHGIAVVTGPTGSGKTTSLFEMMKHQARLFPESRQITIEDPPEYPQPWAITLAADGGAFQEMIRHSLRMDPDMILIGEIRAGAEGIAAIQAAMTGHFVWTTLHVLDPYEVFNRLETLDKTLLHPRITCNHKLMAGLIAQRIVQVLCPECCVPLDKGSSSYPRHMIERLASWGAIDKVRIRGGGCPHCDGQSIVGRTAVAEIVLPDEEFMSNFRERGEAVARREHRAKPTSDKSMLANAMDLVFDGRADPMDVQRSVGDIVLREDGL